MHLCLELILSKTRKRLYLRGDDRAGSFLKQFLISALDAAIPLKQMHHIAVLVSQDLQPEQPVQSRKTLFPQGSMASTEAPCHWPFQYQDNRYPLPCEHQSRQSATFSQQQTPRMGYPRWSCMRSLMPFMAYNVRDMGCRSFLTKEPADWLGY